jgi:hypothetical protein
VNGSRRSAVNNDAGPSRVPFGVAVPRTSPSGGCSRCVVRPRRLSQLLVYLVSHSLAAGVGPPRAAIFTRVGSRAPLPLVWCAGAHYLFLGWSILAPAPRLYSTSRLMRVAITSVHPGCALHPVHPGCTSGYGDGWAGMLAGAWSGLYASFVRPGPPQNGLGQVEKKTGKPKISSSRIAWLASTRRMRTKIATGAGCCPNKGKSGRRKARQRRGNWGH